MAKSPVPSPAVIWNAPASPVYRTPTPSTKSSSCVDTYSSVTTAAVSTAMVPNVRSPDPVIVTSFAVSRIVYSPNVVRMGVSGTPRLKNLGENELGMWHLRPLVGIWVATAPYPITHPRSKHRARNSSICSFGTVTANEVTVWARIHL